jgi:putative CocE/NonD family hydrolase
MGQATTKASFQPQFAVKQLKNVPIPLPDGIHLSADLFLPDGAGQFPCVLNYIPYRKQDASAYTGAICNDFATHGFASAIVDIRGTGESQGITLDEYTLQEQQDGCEVIDWLSRQPWCNGNVGMWGASYSGFNSIQIAMHAPPALKAIVPMFATDDRYNDDVHYYGGCLIGVEQVLYPAMMVTMNAIPPYRETAGGDWSRMWKERLDGNRPWILNWFEHQTEDDYWKPGSLKTDYASIKCPVYNIGGWADGYTNPVFRMQQHLQVPHKAMVGPWLHNAPSSGIPGPNVDFLREMRRWWAQWLRGEETGIMQEPKMAVYIQHGAGPTPYEAYMPGMWRYLDNWPVEGVYEQAFYLSRPGTLTLAAGKEAESDAYRYQATVGAAAGVWCAVSGIDGMTRDQSADEGRSLTYTSRILDQPVEILGAPKAILHVASTAEVAFFCVKISDISPDGASRLVCRGILNATHRNSHVHPEPVQPGEVMELEIPLKFSSWTFQAGHRIRVSISSSDWPWVWPSPYPAINQVHLGSYHPSRILLPVVKEPHLSNSDFHFQDIPKTYAMQGHGESVFGAQPTWYFTQDIVKGYSVLHVGNQGRGQLPDSAVIFQSDSQAEFGTSDEKPESTFAKGLCKSSIIECDGNTEISGRTSIRSTTSNFFIDIELKVEKDGEPFFDRTWSEVFPRNLL